MRVVATNQNSVTCWECDGTGKVWKHTVGGEQVVCPICRGAGQIADYSAQIDPYGDEDPALAPVGVWKPGARKTH